MRCRDEVLEQWKDTGDWREVGETAEQSLPS